VVCSRQKKVSVNRHSVVVAGDSLNRLVHNPRPRRTGLCSCSSAARIHRRHIRSPALRWLNSRTLSHCRQVLDRTNVVRSCSIRNKGDDKCVLQGPESSRARKNLGRHCHSDAERVSSRLSTRRDVTGVGTLAERIAGRSHVRTPHRIDHRVEGLFAGGSPAPLRFAAGPSNFHPSR